MSYIQLYEGSSCESALEYYTGKGYELINSYMRGDNIDEIVEFEYQDQFMYLDEEERDEALEEVRLDLDDLIRELYSEFTELEKDLVVYRGGGKKKDKAFRSYTTDRKVAERYGKVEELKLKKGTQVINTLGRGWSEGESEIILEPND